MPVPSSWHPGELAAQQARGFEDAAWGMYHQYQEGAPSFMATFLSSLPFLSVTTLDQNKLPWTSLICNDGRPGFIQSEGGDLESRFKCTIQAPNGIPLRECLLRLHGELSKGIEPYDENGDARQAFQLAAVGVMLQNRRRNKMEGVIVSIEKVPASDDESQFIFRIDVSNTFGNCPKYINARLLVPLQGDLVPSSMTMTQGDGSTLPTEILSILASTDMLFLSTKHSGSSDAYPVDLSRLGNNIRGGPSGFLRVFFDEEVHRQAIILPDWSGNRLMQSFGNMTHDHVAGITIPIWSNESGRRSDLLHLTCDALVLAGEEAGQLIRGIQGAVKLWPRRWTLVRNALPLMEAQDQVAWSPYNPPVRLLNSEKPLLTAKGIKRPTASLIAAHFHSPVIATFTFQVDTPFAYRPGQHVIFDCFNLLDTRIQMYTHMAQYRGGEKDLNDDGTRSWTISFASSEPISTIQQFEVTLRRKERGGVTPSLFRRGWLLREGAADLNELTVEVLGIGGSCLLPSTENPSKDTLQLAYLLSGIGITPMLPHLSQLAQSQVAHAKVLAVIAVKWDEIEVAKQLIRRALTRIQSSNIKLHLEVFLLAGQTPDGQSEDEEKEEQDQGSLTSNITISVSIHRGERLQPWSLTLQQEKQASDGFLLPGQSCLDLQTASQIVVCAGDAFSRIAGQAIRQAGISDDRIKQESFSF